MAFVGESDLFLSVPSVSLCTASLGKRQLSKLLDCYDSVGRAFAAIAV